MKRREARLGRLERELGPGEQDEPEVWEIGTRVIDFSAPAGSQEWEIAGRKVRF